MKRVIAVSVISSLLTAILTLGVVETLHPPQAEAQTSALVGTSLELRDNTGAVRARIAPSNNGVYTLSLLDGSNVRAFFGTETSGQPVFAMLDRQGQALVSLSALDDESTALVMKDGNNVIRLGVGVNPNGQPVVSLRDPDGNNVASLP